MLSPDNIQRIILEGIESIEFFFIHHRYTTAFLVSALKGWAADFIAQKAESRAKDTEDEETQTKTHKPFQFNYKRNFAFLCYGGVYQGCFQEYLYNEQFNQLFGSDSGLQTAVMKVVFNLLVIAPFLCLPMAYVIKAVVFNQTLPSGMRNYVHDVRQNGLVIKYWMVWGPVNTLTFTVVPEHFRITFMACISFFWSIVLSSMSGKNKGQ